MRANKQRWVCHRQCIVVLYHPGRVRVRVRVRVVQMMKRFEAQLCHLMRKCLINMAVRRRIFRAPNPEIKARAHLERRHIVVHSNTVVAAVARRGLSRKFQWVFLKVI